MSLVITLHPPPQSSFPPCVFVADVKNYYKMTIYNIYMYTVNGKIIGVNIFFIRSALIPLNIVSCHRCSIPISFDCYKNDRFIQIGYNSYNLCYRQ